MRRSTRLLRRSRLRLTSAEGPRNDPQRDEPGAKGHRTTGPETWRHRARGGSSPQQHRAGERADRCDAQARDWVQVKVTGTERFRKEAWFAAGLVGIEVRGYKPTAFEEERMARAISRRQAGAAGRGPDESGNEKSSRSLGAARGEPTASPRDSGPITGRLVDHGRANYRHDPKEPMSYYVRIETTQGDREIWGVDLERAFRESLSRPTIGDEVTVRSDVREPVTVTSAERDADGRVVGQREISTHRN